MKKEYIVQKLLFEVYLGENFTVVNNRRVRYYAFICVEKNFHFTSD